MRELNFLGKWRETSENGHQSRLGVNEQQSTSRCLSIYGDKTEIPVTESTPRLYPQQATSRKGERQRNKRNRSLIEDLK
ncbi:hypothetical protein V1478_005990 [Vespula squamosa]|uniref:Uncharacterized protein n=1 Tax=Vespula squamosa TaxID=30214 RepID=A0ABD2B8Z9_VESSQ